jgi:hypothetical protein
MNKPGTLSLLKLRNLETLSFEKPNELTTILINDIDHTNKVNSKTHILDKCDNINFYTLKNVKWTLDDDAEISNNRILILDRILDRMTPYTPQNQREPETSETSLTGTVTVTSNAYNSADALDIYNYYASEVIREEKDAQGNVVK